ncbi:hypothetical protein CC80DRAFT_503543 [Byssothecium circinans]|uniref:Uncharacterized protein n=1 Tax=Byssothecium circinans TaxID=147558 RepID=A0A6A5U141_9PLEO|nr:hypothetical protein CC80DRAFT_503543 [Byssothecium circinans]
MPPVSQFPPARVFLKNANATVGGAGNSGSLRRASLTTNPIPRHANMASSTSPLGSQSAVQRTGGAQKALSGKGSARQISDRRHRFHLPRRLAKVRIAWMSCGGSVDFKDFEHQDPAYQLAPEFEYNGVICFQSCGYSARR